MSTVISVAGLKKSYGANQAVNGVDLQISQGEIFALLGPNGAGKTTTVEILEGFRDRDSGETRGAGRAFARGEIGGVWGAARTERIFGHREKTRGESLSQGRWRDRVFVAEHDRSDRRHRVARDDRRVFFRRCAQSVRVGARGGDEGRQARRPRSAPLHSGRRGSVGRAGSRGR